MLRRAQELVFGGLKACWEEEVRKSEGWRKALCYYQLKSRRESFINWAFFVQRAKQQRFVAELISNRLNTRIKEEFFQGFMKAYLEHSDLREREEELRRVVNKRVATDALNIMLNNAPIMAVERGLHERAALYSQYRLFRKVVTSILIHREKKLEKTVAIKQAAQQWRGSLLNRGFNLLAINLASSKTLMIQAGEVHMRRLLEKGMGGMKLWIGMAKEQIPLYSNRQVFLAHKYFSMLGRHTDAHEMTHIRPPAQESERTRTNRDSRRYLQAAPRDEPSEEHPLSLSGDVERSDASIEAPRGTAIVYEFPQMSTRFNRKRLEHSTACLNHLIMEKIFTTWKNRVVKKKEFGLRRQFKMLALVFKGLQAYYWQKSEENYLESRASSFYRKRLLEVTTRSLWLNSTKLKQLREIERHYIVSRAQRLKERILTCMRGAFYSSTDERRRIMLSISLCNRWSKKRVIGLLTNNVAAQRRLSAAFDEIRKKNQQHLVQQVWTIWSDQLIARARERIREQKVALATKGRVLAPCFGGWRYWASCAAKNRMLVEAHRHHSGLLALERLLRALRQHAESSRKAKLFDLVLANYHLRKLMKKGTIGLRCFCRVSKQKKQMQAAANIVCVWRVQRTVSSV